MKILSFMAAAMLFCTVHAAEYEGYDFPYTILKDKGTIRYCLDPGGGATKAKCWSDGTEFLCDAVPAEEGFIGDCKEVE